MKNKLYAVAILCPYGIMNRKVLEIGKSILIIVWVPPSLTHSTPLAFYNTLSMLTSTEHVLLALLFFR